MDMTYRENLAKNTFINSPGEVKFDSNIVFDFVPTISPLQLLIFAFKYVSPNNVKTDEVLILHSIILVNMLIKFFKSI